MNCEDYPCELGYMCQHFGGMLKSFHPQCDPVLLQKWITRYRAHRQWFNESVAEAQAMAASIGGRVASSRDNGVTEKLEGVLRRILQDDEILFGVYLSYAKDEDTGHLCAEGARLIALYKAAIPLIMDLLLCMETPCGLDECPLCRVFTEQEFGKALLAYSSIDEVSDILVVVYRTMKDELDEGDECKSLLHTLKHASKCEESLDSLFSSCSVPNCATLHAAKRHYLGCTDLGCFYCEAVNLKMGLAWRPSCRVCGLAMERISSCGNCESVHYCSNDCARVDWKIHKAHCKQARKSHDALSLVEEETYLARLNWARANERRKPRPEMPAETQSWIKALFCHLLGCFDPVCGKRGCVELRMYMVQVAKKKMGHCVTLDGMDQGRLLTRLHFWEWSVKPL